MDCCLDCCLCYSVRLLAETSLSHGKIEDAQSLDYWLPETKTFLQQRLPTCIVFMTWHSSWGAFCDSVLGLEVWIRCCSQTYSKSVLTAVPYNTPSTETPPCHQTPPRIRTLSSLLLPDLDSIRVARGGWIRVFSFRKLDCSSVVCPCQLWVARTSGCPSSDVFPLVSHWTFFCLSGLGGGIPHR